MTRLYDVHPRTHEASARCKERGSCHDCAMTCPHGNTVTDDGGVKVPCGTEIFDADGHIKTCGECQADERRILNEESYL